MAKNITAQVAGGDAKPNLTGNTVGEIATQVGAQGFTATVNGEPASADQSLSDYEYVAFAKPVKAG